MTGLTRTIEVAILCLGFIGCAAAPPMPTEATFQTYGGISQAAFALSCPKEQLSIQVLRPIYANCAADFGPSCCNDSQVGVTGCGRKAVYVCSRGQWMNNTPAQQPQ
jgi:hypothetical protein